MARTLRSPRLSCAGRAHSNSAGDWQQRIGRNDANARPDFNLGSRRRDDGKQANRNNWRHNKSKAHGSNHGFPSSFPESKKARLNVSTLLKPSAAFQFTKIPAKKVQIKRPPPQKLVGRGQTPFRPISPALSRLERRGRFMPSPGSAKLGVVFAKFACSWYRGDQLGDFLANGSPGSIRKAHKTPEPANHARTNIPNENGSRLRTPEPTWGQRFTRLAGAPSATASANPGAQLRELARLYPAAIPSRSSVLSGDRFFKSGFSPNLEERHGSHFRLRSAPRSTIVSRPRSTKHLPRARRATRPEEIRRWTPARKIPRRRE